MKMTDVNASHGCVLKINQVFLSDEIIKTTKGDCFLSHRHLKVFQPGSDTTQGDKININLL